MFLIVTKTKISERYCTIKFDLPETKLNLIFTQIHIFRNVTWKRGKLDEKLFPLLINHHGQYYVSYTFTSISFSIACDKNSPTGNSVKFAKKIPFENFVWSAPTNFDCSDWTQRIRFPAFSLQKLQQFRCSYYFKGRPIGAPSTPFPNRVHRPTVNLITKNYCHRADRACRASSRAPRSRVSSVSPICGWLTATFVFQKWPDSSGSAWSCARRRDYALITPIFSIARQKRDPSAPALSWLPSLVIFTFRGTFRHRATAPHITIRDESANEEKGISVENPLQKKKRRERLKFSSIFGLVPIFIFFFLFPFLFLPSPLFFFLPRSTKDQREISELIRSVNIFLSLSLAPLGDYCNYC